MNDISELEQRISAALARLGRAVEDLADAPAPDGALAAAEAEVDRLGAELAAERDRNEQLNDRVRAIKEKTETLLPTLERRNERYAARLEAQGAEMQRLRKQVTSLRDAVRGLREAAEAGVTDPELVNKALRAELEALRAERNAEITELDGVLAELDPLVTREETTDARA